MNNSKSKSEILEQEIDCKFTKNEIVTINFGVYKGFKAKILGVSMYEENVKYKVQLQPVLNNKSIELEFDELRLDKQIKFKIPFVRN